MALAIHALAWWLTIDRRRRWTRLAIFNGVSAVLFFCHIAAYAVFCVMVGLYEATPRPGEGRRAWAARVWPTPFHVAAGALLWLFTVPFESRFGGSGMKIASLAAPMIEHGLASGVVETMGLTIGLAIGLQRRRLTLAPAMRGVLVGLLAVIVVLPPASGAADFIDARLAVLLAYLAVASLGGPRGLLAKRWVAAAAVVVTLARVGEAAPDWSAYARQAAELRQAIEVIASGERVLVAEPPSSACRPVSAQDYLRGLTSFVVIDRRALVSTLFTGRGMQPVWARDPHMDDTPWLGVPPSWFARHDGRDGRQNWRDSYDALMVLHVGCDWRPDLADLTPISHTAELTIYRTR